MRCEARLQFINVSSASNDWDITLKHVFHLSLPRSKADEPQRHLESTEDYGESLDYAVDALDHAFPNHLFIYTGILNHAVRDSSSSRVPAVPFGSWATRAQLESKSGTSILSRYQLLTPGLLVSLLLVLFLIIPIVAFAIRALASVRASFKIDSRSRIGSDKKNQ